MRSDIVFAVQRSTSLDKTEKAVMLALAIRWNRKTGQCNPSIPTLCDDTGWGRTSVIEALNRLELKGYIATNKKHRKSNQYELRIEAIGTTGPEPKSPPGGPEQSVEQTSVVRLLDATSPRCGPQVISEVINRSKKEVKGDLANKVDYLLKMRDLFLDDNGEINVSKVTRMILQRAGMLNTVPTGDMFKAVAKCVAYHEKQRIQSLSSQQCGSN